MKYFLIYISILGGLLITSCNDDVFVRRPEPEKPIEKPDPEPGPGPDEEFTDSFMLKSIDYQMSTLSIQPEPLVLQSQSNFINYTSNTGVSILFDNYNSTWVKIYNSTYYVLPWAKEQPLIEVPGINADGEAGFFGTKIPFAFGNTYIPAQYMAGHIERFDLPPNSKVTATVTVTRRIVEVRGDISYYIDNYPDPSIVKNWAQVVVTVPVDISVEWGEVTPAE